MNASNETQPNETPDWESCPHGEIGDLVGRLRVRRRRQHLPAIVLSGAVAALAIAVGLAMMNRSHDDTTVEGIFVGGIWCSDVLKWSDEFVAGQLDAVRSRQVTDHLAQCDACRQKLLEMQNSAAPPVPTEVDIRNDGRETLNGQPVSLALR